MSRGRSRIRRWETVICTRSTSNFFGRKGHGTAGCSAALTRCTMPNSKSGLTLIELLVTTAILSVISLAIYSSLNSGIKVWQRTTREIPYEGLDIFFNKFASDVHNVVRITGINFSGTDEMVEFATLVKSPLGAGSAPGRVRYVYDPHSHKMTRSQQDYSQVYTGEEAAKEQSLTADVTSLKFRYYIYDKETKEYLWKEEFREGEFPRAVGIELESGYGEKARTFTKTVDIPVAS